MTPILRGGAARERGYGEEGAKGIFCATTSIPCGGRRLVKKARRGSSARQHQSRAGRSGAGGCGVEEGAGHLLRDNINSVRRGAAREGGDGEEGAGHLLRDNINPVRGGAAREDVV